MCKKKKKKGKQTTDLSFFVIAALLFEWAVERRVAVSLVLQFPLDRLELLFAGVQFVRELSDLALLVLRPACGELCLQQVDAVVQGRELLPSRHRLLEAPDGPEVQLDLGPQCVRIHAAALQLGLCLDV